MAKIIPNVAGYWLVFNERGHLVYVADFESEAEEWARTHLSFTEVSIHLN